MGCGASKVSPSTSGNQQQHGKQTADKGPEKPLSKNQVAPYPPHTSTATEALKSHAGSSTSTSTDSSKASAFTSSPETLAADLKRLCCQQIPGTDLQILAEQFHSLVGYLAPFLRVHAHVSKVPILSAVAADARRCISAVLGPVLTHMERLLSGKQATSPLTGDPVSWDDMEFPDLLCVLEAACNHVFSLGVMEVGRPVALLLDVLTQLQQHCIQRSFPLPAAELQVGTASAACVVMHPCRHSLAGPHNARFNPAHSGTMVMPLLTITPCLGLLPGKRYSCNRHLHPC